MARACDRCVKKRARWYCAADDAFLCQSCDVSIHWPNQSGTGQHKRVLLHTGPSNLYGSGDQPEPPWYQGFIRRARTPRQRVKYPLKVEGKNKEVNSSVPLVPEIGSLEASLLDDDEEVEQQQHQQQRLLYCVPVFDPFETELSNDSNEIDGSLPFIVDKKEETCHDLDDLLGFGHPTDDLELLEFAADVESLLGKELDNTSCRIEELGLTNNYKEEDNTKNIGLNCFVENRVKVEDKEVEAILGFDFDATRETLDRDFDYQSSRMIKEEEPKGVVGIEREHTMTLLSEGKVRTSSMVLRLNYEDVINTWGDQGSPWTTGTRPKLNSDGSWPNLMASRWAWKNNPSYGRVGEREARVSRYREKRRSRLFSKKIRYEVRKLNAEKRPRMKGRFVKRELNL